MAYIVLHADAFEDNYIWVVVGDAPPGSTARPAVIIDPGDDTPVFDLIDAKDLAPVAILCTHRHPDHVAGAGALAARFTIPVYAPARANIAAATHPVDEGDRIAFPELDLRFEVLSVPGHTGVHIAYYTPGMLFCGDTLFSAGCGRLFDGTAAQLFTSLSRLGALPGDTAVYCGHEYTAANLRFAHEVEPDNAAIMQHTAQVAALRQRNLPSLPSRIDLELEINPFLRSHLASVRRAAEHHAGHSLVTDMDVFTEIRRWKDRFRG